MLILRFKEQFARYYHDRPEVQFRLKDLATRSGVSKVTLLSMQNPNYNATLEMLEKVAGALELSPLDLVEDVPGRKRKKHRAPSRRRGQG